MPGAQGHITVLRARRGADGKGIVSQTDWYAVSESKTAAPTAWTAGTPPDMTRTLRYLWRYTETVYSDGSSAATTPCVVGTYGADGLSVRYSRWAAGVEYRNDNNPYYRDSDGKGYIDVALKGDVTVYDPASGGAPPAAFVCKKTHTSSSDGRPLAAGEYWTAMNSTAPILTALVLADTIKASCIDTASLAADEAFVAELTVNRLIAGERNGQRVEITPENKSMNIHDSSGELVAAFEGNTYTDIPSLFGGGSGSLTVTAASGSASVGRSPSTGTAVLTAAKLTTGPVKLTVGAGTVTIAAMAADADGLVTGRTATLRAVVYSDSACSHPVEYDDIVYLYNDGTAKLEKSVAGLTRKTACAGYTRLELYYGAAFVGSPSTSAGFSWSGLAGVTYTADFYVARYFGNGFVLGASATNYIAVYRDGSGKMTLDAACDTFGFRLSPEGARYRRSFDTSYRYLSRNDASYSGIPLNARAAGQFKLGKNASSTAMGTYRTCDGDTVSIAYVSAGTYRVTTPSAWGVCLAMLTAAGRTAAYNPFVLSTHNHTSAGFSISAKSSADNWLAEDTPVPVSFIIFRAEDF